MSTDSHDFIFVYGTLLQGIQSNVAQYFHAHALFVSEGFMAGELYDLGMYPGAVFDANSPDKVYGHIFQLKNPTTTLQVLDQYEGCPPDRPQPTEYVRRRVSILFKNEKKECWVYVYNFPTDKKVKIESGNYLSFLEGNNRHQGFIDSV